MISNETFLQKTDSEERITYVRYALVALFLITTTTMTIFSFSAEDSKAKCLRTTIGVEDPAAISAIIAHCEQKYPPTNAR